MSRSSRRTVITGIGVLSSIGKDVNSFWESLLAGRCGIRQIQAFDASGLPVRIAAEIEDFKPKDYTSPEQLKTFRKSLRVMARTIQLAVASAHLALVDGNVDTQSLNPTRFGVEFGAGLIATELIELGEASQVADTERFHVDYERWGSEAIAKIPPLWMLKYLPNMLACQVSILHNAQGPNNSITEGDVASLLALGESYRILQRDGADIFLVGGADSKINSLSFVRQCLFEPLSQRNDDPEKAYRPFDKNRDGMVLGEGGTVLVVEELEHARKRGARVYAEVVGHGAAFDHKRDGRGLARAIRAAMKEAEIVPEQVDHVNAHGLGTREADIQEASAIREVLGATPVLAPKSYIGNLGAGGGISELAASILALDRREVPSTLNFETPDPECPIEVISGSPRELTKPYVMKLSFTQMGQCGAIVLKTFED